MLTLSIITINYNNAEGLRKTLASVASQTYRDIEHIIIDGGSTDGSVDVIREYEKQNSLLLGRDGVGLTIKWLSEPDKGIYNAMNKGIEIALGRRVVNALNRSELVENKNKGIEIALGKRVIDTFNRSELVGENHTSNIIHNILDESRSDYIQILNSGDLLAAPDVTERMMNALNSFPSGRDGVGFPAIFYGNMIKKDYTTGKVIGKSREVEYSLRNYYSGTMNHDCCYFRHDLFETYGLYDENLKIVSDWKWFLQAIGLGQVKPEYVDIDVTIFDASGISETNLALRNQERRQVLKELLPPAILADYDAHAFEMEQMNRLRRSHLYGLVYFIERVLFKLEKWHILR